MPGQVTQTGGTSTALTDAEWRAQRAGSLPTATTTPKTTLGKAPVGTTGGTTAVAPTGSQGGTRAYAPTRVSSPTAPPATRENTPTGTPAVAVPVQPAPAPYQTPATWSVQGGFNMYDPSASEYTFGANAGQLSAPGAAETYNPGATYAGSFGQTAQGQLAGVTVPALLNNQSQIERYAAGSGPAPNQGGDFAAGGAGAMTGDAAYAGSIGNVAGQTGSRGFANNNANFGVAQAGTASNSVANQTAYMATGPGQAQAYADNAGQNYNAAMMGTNSFGAQGQTVGSLGMNFSQGLAQNPTYLNDVGSNTRSVQGLAGDRRLVDQATPQLGRTDQAVGAGQGAATTNTRSDQNLQTGLSELQGPLQTQVALASSRSALGSPTEGKSALDATRGIGPGVSADNYGQSFGQLGRQSAAERFDGAQTIDREMGSTAAGKYLQSLPGDALPPKDMSQYYDRAREKGVAQLDRASASRGLFNSSAALDQQREFATDIGAQQSQAEADYAVKAALAKNDIMGGAANAADASGLARYNTLLGSAQAADEGQIGRLGLSGTQANAVDEEERQRAGLIGSQAQGVDAETRERAGLIGDQASNADAASLARSIGRGQLAGAADAAGNNAYATDTAARTAADRLQLERAGLDVTRFNSLTGAQNAADQAAIDAARYGLDTAGQADQGIISRFVAQNDAARGVDAAGLGVANLGLQATLGADANSLGRYVAQNNVANNVDQAGLASYMGQAGVQNAADTVDTNRFSSINNAAQGLDQNNIASYIGQGNLMNQADQNNLASYMGQAGVQNMATQGALDRIQAAQQAAQGADQSALGYSNLGLSAAQAADQAEISRLGLLGQGAASADAGRINRSTAFGNQLGATTAAALGLTGSAYGDMFGADQGYIDGAIQMGFGAGGQALAGAQGNQAAVGAQGAANTQIGANVDSTNRQILLGS